MKQIILLVEDENFEKAEEVIDSMIEKSGNIFLHGAFSRKECREMKEWSENHLKKMKEIWGNNYIFHV